MLIELTARIKCEDEVVVTKVAINPAQVLRANYATFGRDPYKQPLPRTIVHLIGGDMLTVEESVEEVMKQVNTALAPRFLVDINGNRSRIIPMEATK